MIAIIITIQVCLWGLLTVVLYSTKNFKKYKVQLHINENKKVKNIQDYLIAVQSKQIVKNKYILALLDFKVLVIATVVIYSLAIVLIYAYIKIVLASFILAFPFACIPIVCIRLLEQNEKNQILKQLPIYIVNLKSQMENDNNIILAMKRTKTTNPFNKYMDKFLISLKAGENIYSAFEELKMCVNITCFNSFVDSLSICYKNGGKYVTLLDRFNYMLSKKLLNNEKFKEQAYSSVITLVVMLVMNIFLLITFTFQNQEYATIMQNTVAGKLIVNFCAMSYIAIIVVIYKIYRVNE